MLDVIEFDVCTSTNDVACAMAVNGAAEGTVVTARKQTEGRGRLKRRWFTEEGALAFSYIARPTVLPRFLPRLTHLVASTLLDITHALGARTCIKWPNDLVMLGPSGVVLKIGGVLVETATSSDEVRAAIVGVGINVVRPRGGFTEEIRDIAASLEDAGARITPHELLSFLVPALRAQIPRIADSAHWNATLDKLRNHSATLGKTVRIRQNDVDVNGTAADIDDNGALIIADAHGILHTIYSGDLVCLES